MGGACKEEGGRGSGRPYAVLLSGGIGSRLPSKVPKQYLFAGGHRIVTRALAALLRCPLVEAVWVAAEASWREDIRQDAQDAGLPLEKLAGFAPPGASRQASIWNALQAIRKDVGAIGGEDTVLLHDAARPGLSTELLSRIYGAYPGHEGVLPVLPMKDTVYVSRKGDRVEALLDRDGLYAGQAPELFHFEKYEAATAALLPEKIHRIRGSAEAAFLAGMDVGLVSGEEANRKITTRADLEWYLRSLEVSP